MRTESGKFMDNLISFLNFLMNFCHMDMRNKVKKTDYSGGYRRGGLAFNAEGRVTKGTQSEVITAANTY